MNCTICQEHSNEEVVHTDCGHSFHISCIAGWVIRNDTCPLCRSENPCGINTYYYTLYYYTVHGLIDGYVVDLYLYQFYSNTVIRYMDPGCYSVFIRDFGGDTDTLPLNVEENVGEMATIEETIQHDNDGFQDEIDAYDQWEHENDHDY
jgi:hypothetical protein